MVFHDGGPVGADARALAAADAQLLLDIGLAGVVHFHFAGARAAAHADILDGAADALGLVALKMRQGNDDIRIHHGAANLRLFDVLAALDGDEHLVGAL